MAKNSELTIITLIEQVSKTLCMTTIYAKRLMYTRSFINYLRNPKRGQRSW